MIRLTAWTSDAPGPIAKLFDDEAQAEVFRSSLGDRLCGAIRDEVDEDAHFAAIWAKRFAKDEADYYAPRFSLSLSCCALERSAPVRGVYSESIGTCVDPRALNALHARSFRKKAKNQHTCQNAHTS